MPGYSVAENASRSATGPGACCESLTFLGTVILNQKSDCRALSGFEKTDFWPKWLDFDMPTQVKLEGENIKTQAQLQ